MRLGQIRNFDHLLLTRQLYQDASDSADRGDKSLLTRSLVILDLSIELALKNILLNLDPDFAPTQGKRDINWHELWSKTNAALERVAGTGLSERSECTRLHEFRNLVQHHGFDPTKPDLTRYLGAADRMLSDALRDAFGLDFRNLRHWDFVENEGIRRLLNESDEFLKNGNPVVCMIGCKWARRIILEAMRKNAAIRDGYAPLLDSRARNEARPVREVLSFLLDWNKYTARRIRRLEDELVLIGFGLSTTDTRLFLSAQGFTGESMMADGHIEVQLNGKPERDVAERESSFMLNYLYRLMRALGESNADALGSITVKIPLSEQRIVSFDWFKDRA